MPEKMNLDGDTRAVPGDSNMPPCANCGTPWSRAAEHRFEQMYDGEWVCSAACEEEHSRLGCPFEHGPNYRVPFAERGPAPTVPRTAVETLRDTWRGWAGDQGSHPQWRACRAAAATELDQLLAAHAGAVEYVHPKFGHRATLLYRGEGVSGQRLILARLNGGAELLQCTEAYFDSS